MASTNQTISHEKSQKRKAITGTFVPFKGRTCAAFERRRQVRHLNRAVLQLQPGRTEQPRIIATFSPHNPTTFRGNGESALHNLSSRSWRKQIERRRYAAADHDHFRIEDVDDVCHRHAEINSHAP